MSVIFADRIEKSYQRGSISTPVLRGVDFNVPQGECVFLVGPSGSGKSTLLSILGCLLSPDTGSLTILDHDISQLSACQKTALRRDRIGFIFQRFNLIEGLNSLENICVPLRLRNLSPRQIQRRGNELLELVGLEEHATARPSQMSAGQCQRIGIARALALSPDLILADEPTASLDAQCGQEILELFQQLIRREKKTAVVVTHDPRIFKFADRICQVEGGRLNEARRTANMA